MAGQGAGRKRPSGSESWRSSAPTSVHQPRRKMLTSRHRVARRGRRYPLEGLARRAPCGRGLVIPFPQALPERGLCAPLHRRYHGADGGQSARLSQHHPQAPQGQDDGLGCEGGRCGMRVVCHWAKLAWQGITFLRGVVGFSAPHKMPRQGSYVIFSKKPTLVST
jgi:hypothetical protein